MSDAKAQPPAGEPITLIELLDQDTPSQPSDLGVDLFGRYRVLGLLGSGGMGAVYRVWDAILDDEVALKMLRRELLSEAGMLARFRSEVKLARRVTHRNVVRTFDLGEHDGEYYLTMEYVRGKSVRRILSEDGPFPLGRALDVARQASAGIAAAHASGVLHCDLKPDNLLLDEAGRVAITDFGIARAMGGRDGFIAGTPAYMAPEVSMRGEVDSRSDLYSLGAVVYELLTGRSAFADPEQRRGPELRLGRPAPDLREAARVPDEVAELVSSLLAPRPAERPVSAAQVLEMLEDLGAHTSRRSTPPERGSVPVASTTSVAVLPFINAGDPEDQHLAEGLTEEIIDALSSTRELRVRPLSTTLAAPSDGGALAAGRVLDVQAVVEGTVRRRLGEVVLAVRLIGVADGFQLWARRFRCGTGDALVVAEEVARAIATALAAELGGGQRPQTSDPVALELYLRARYTLRVGWDHGAGEAVGLLEQSLARRPDNPDALAIYTMALARQAFFEQRTGADLAATLDRMRRAANEAVRLAPEQGDAWLALANAHLYSGFIPEAARALREAVRRSPGLARAQQMLGSMALEVGRTDEAFERLQAAVSIDPEAGQARMDLARGHALLGLWRQADEILDAGGGASTEEVLLLTRARLSLWAPNRGFTMPLQPLSNSASGRMVYSVLQLYQQVHTSGTLPQGIEQQYNRSNPGDLRLLRAVQAQYVCEILAAVGRLDDALEALRSAVDAGLNDLFWMERCPLLLGARAHPGWSNLYTVVAGRAATIRAALEGR